MKSRSRSQSQSRFKYLAGTWRVRVAAATCGVAFAVTRAAGADDAAPVEAAVKWTDGRIQNLSLVGGKTAFHTFMGKLTLPLSGLQRLEARADGLVAHTVRGDLWNVSSADPVRYRDSGRNLRLNLNEPGLESITFPPATGGDWIPREHAKLLLRDGSMAFLDVCQWTIRVRNEGGTWELPVGSVRLLSMTSPSADAEEAQAIVKFPAGQLATFVLSGLSSSFRATDTFGNDLKVPLSETKGLLGRVGIEHVFMQKTAREERTDADHLTVFDGSGRGQPVAAPPLVWSLVTPMGRVLLPSPILSAVEPDPARPSAHRLTTVFGDVLTGTLSPQSLRVHLLDADTPLGTVSLRDGRSIRYPSADLLPPSDWPVWRLAGGDTFRARIAQDSESEFDATDGVTSRKIPIESIANLRRDGNRFLVTTRSGDRVPGRPGSRSQNLVLLCNGTQHVLRWSDLEEMSTGSLPPGRSDGTAAASEAPAPPPQQPYAGSVFHWPFGRGQRVPAADDGAEAPASSLTIETSFGRLVLPTNSVGRIWTDARGVNVCCQTVFGEIFTGRSRARPARTSGDERGLPAERVRNSGITVVELSPLRREPPPDWLACRLETGDVFYMRVSGDTVTVKSEGQEDRPVEYPVSSLRSIHRDERDRFVFRTDLQTRVGRPSSRRMDMALLHAEQVMGVGYDLIERIQRGSLSSLPPPASFRGAWLPVQEGMVRLPGGKYVRGRTRGEGGEDEVPAHEVAIAGFLMDECEVTRGQFARFASESGYVSDAERASQPATWREPGFRQRDDEPALCMSWFDAARFCNWRSEKAGVPPCYEFKKGTAEVVCRRERGGYRLPTEAEWEYAARAGGLDILFPWGDDASESNAVGRTNFRPSGSVQDQWIWTSPVKSYPSNAAGLFDMAGNVWEWCEDWYSLAAYGSAHRFDTLNPCVQAADFPGLSRRVMRGGSFANELDMLRCAGRGYGFPRDSAARVGFRCVRNEPSPTVP